MSRPALSTGGKVFFGSLCAGTFALGCWQTQRLLEKQKLVDIRQADLQADAVELDDYQEGSFRRVSLQGTFDHQHEFLVGPRGPPPGALPDKPGSSAAGMSAAPQGYLVLTPLSVGDRSVLVNRGWVPRSMVTEDIRRRPRSGAPSVPLYQWSRPTGIVSLMAVPATPETPKFLVANHDLKKRPPRLYWFDWPAMKAVAGYAPEATPAYLTAVRPSHSNATSLPIAPPADKVGDFKVTPAIHAGYAFTWFGLSAAGFYMTRKLILKGR